MNDPDPDAAADYLITQAATLFGVHDHVSRVIANLDIPTEALTDNYRVKNEKTFKFESMVRLFIYKEVCDYSQKRVSKEVDNWPYLQQRFGFDRAPTQQDISYTYRRRFGFHARLFFNRVAEGIRDAAEENDVRTPGITTPPKPGPDEVAESQIPLHHYVANHAPDIIKKGQDKIFTAFDTGRAHNTKHEDSVHWEHQSLMSLQDRAGTRAAFYTYNMYRSDALHHDTHCRSVKKLGTPDLPAQQTLDQYASNTSSTPYWRSVASTIQEQYSDAISNIMDEIIDSPMFAQPVAAAIDTTQDPFYVSPWKKEKDEKPDDERIVVSEKTGLTKVPKDDYPEMVHGSEDEDHTYAYEYATLTIIGWGVPIVLAVEPIRKNSKWEGDDGYTVSKAETVHRLLEQAKQHVDIHLVMADRAFDSYPVYHVLDQYHDVDYLIPKTEKSDELRELKEDYEEDEFLNTRVEQGVPLPLEKVSSKINIENDPTVSEGDEFSHDMSLLMVPADREDWVVEEDSGTAMFVTNRQDVSPMDALGFVDRYSQRWDIETEYKMIKPLLPSIASKDYRMRFFAFAFATLLHNLWRMVDHQLKVSASKEYDDYGREPREKRLDTIIPQASVLTAFIHSHIHDGLDPPKKTL